MKTTTLTLARPLPLLLSVVLLLLVNTGCTTTTSTGQKVYDPVKTEKVKALFKQVVADATLLAISKDPRTEAYFDASKQLICATVYSSDPLDPQALRAALEGTGLKPLRTIEAQVAINTICAAYEAAWADRLRADVNANLYAQSVLQVLCDGLTLGLQQSKDLIR